MSKEDTTDQQNPEIMEIAELSSQERKKYGFTMHTARIHHEDGTLMNFPCIVFVNLQTDRIICYTRYELYALLYSEHYRLKEETISKKILNITKFLNYLLYETSINTLTEINPAILHDFFLYAKINAAGTAAVKSNTWHKLVDDVMYFLNRYLCHEDAGIQFHYHHEDLFTSKIVNANGKMNFIETPKTYGVSSPRDFSVRNRILYGEHLELLLWCAAKYDPMLELPVMLSAYAGIREGEVCNLTRSSIVIERTGLENALNPKVYIDLSHTASFMKERGGKTPAARIKKLRRQEVFPDFSTKVISCYERHLSRIDALLERKQKARGYNASEPLILNSRGNPMSVETYCQRLRKLFNICFIPMLEKYCTISGEFNENHFYLQIYKEQYPGAHMFRHWFTMYLKTRTTLSDAEISKWRGDASPESFLTYLHVNSEMVEAYKRCMFIFQESIAGMATKEVFH